MEFAPIRDKLLETTAPSGERVRLPPPAVEPEHLASANRRLDYAPRYGQDTDRVLQDAGFRRSEVGELRESGIVA